MIQITYKGVDITESVSINRCYHDMYAGGQSDTLHLRVNDAKRVWDSWGPAVGDEIRIDYGSVSTGAMFVSAANPQNGVFDIVAQSAPSSGFDVQNKAWQKVRLLQIGAELAKRNGLSFHSYGVVDRLYSYILQTDGDLRFLHRRAQLEGCSVIVYDKKLILYSEEYIEAQTPTESLVVDENGDYKYSDNSALMYNSCVVKSGVYQGEYSAGNGSNRVYNPTLTENIGSNLEARRFAMNLLRSVNKHCYSGYVWSRILPGYAAASMLDLTNVRAPSWDGSVFIDHIRNDYGKGKSKIFFHKPLEGY